jgi:glycosyltransferase involved in cell wall biosynthesis
MLADVFLCTSEHEGFCVPLVEAMYLHVPIVAWGTTAVAETLADVGMVWSECNEALLAESIDAVVENPDLSRTLTARGWRRFHKAFSRAVIEELLQQLLQENVGFEAHGAPASA